MKKRVIVVEHDNGIEGNRGFSDDFSKDEKQDKEILETYAKAGCIVYEYYITYWEY